MFVSQKGHDTHTPGPPKHKVDVGCCPGELMHYGVGILSNWKGYEALACSYTRGIRINTKRITTTISRMCSMMMWHFSRKREYPQLSSIGLSLDFSKDYKELVNSCQEHYRSLGRILAQGLGLKTVA